MGLLFAAGCGGPSAPGSPTVLPGATPPPPSGPPSVVIILADDLGYGDLSSYGSAAIRTPNLDRLAAEGIRFTDFRLPAALCTPTRGSLMTGLYPVQTGLTRVLAWNSGTGIDAEEWTLAEALQERGYATAMVGKWHLGDAPEFLPTRHGFDSYFGIPSSSNPEQLMSNEVFSTEALLPDQILARYTQEAVKLIRQNRGRPFFLYLAHHAPHVPLSPSAQFRGRSAAGAYGDTVEELDAGIGEVLQALAETGDARNTLVFFTSDNGPWLAMKSDGGSPGPLSGGKGTPYEGGIRVPGIMRWPAGFRPGQVIREPVSLLDIFPTVVALAGARTHPDRRYFGQNVADLLTGKVDRLGGKGLDGGRELLAYVAANAQAIRSGPYKYVRAGYWSPAAGLYDVESDPGESIDLRASRPELEIELIDRLDALAGDVALGAPPPR